MEEAVSQLPTAAFSPRPLNCIVCDLWWTAHPIPAKYCIPYCTGEGLLADTRAKCPDYCNWYHVRMPDTCWLTSAQHFRWCWPCR